MRLLYLDFRADYYQLVWTVIFTWKFFLKSIHEVMTVE